MPAATRGLWLPRPNGLLRLGRWSGSAKRPSMVVRYLQRAKKSSVPVVTAASTFAPASATAAAVPKGQSQRKGLNVGAPLMRSHRRYPCAEGASAPRLPPPARRRAPVRRLPSLPLPGSPRLLVSRGRDQCMAPRPRPPARSVARVARELRRHRRLVHTVPAPPAGTSIPSAPLTCLGAPSGLGRPMPGAGCGGLPVPRPPGRPAPPRDRACASHQLATSRGGPARAFPPAIRPALARRPPRTSCHGFGHLLPPGHPLGPSPPARPRPALPPASRPVPVRATPAPLPTPAVHHHTHSGTKVAAARCTTTPVRVPGVNAPGASQPTRATTAPGTPHPATTPIRAPWHPPHAPPRPPGPHGAHRLCIPEPYRPHGVTRSVHRLACLAPMVHPTSPTPPCPPGRLGVRLCTTTPLGPAEKKKTHGTPACMCVPWGEWGARTPLGHSESVTYKVYHVTYKVYHESM